jgi:hypothetical protein
MVYYSLNNYQNWNLTNAFLTSLYIAFIIFTIYNQKFLVVSLKQEDSVQTATCFRKYLKFQAKILKTSQSSKSYFQFLPLRLPLNPVIFIIFIASDYNHPN